MKAGLVKGIPEPVNLVKYERVQHPFRLPPSRRTPVRPGGGGSGRLERETSRRALRDSSSW
jgi:hypothetical protein